MSVFWKPDEKDWQIIRRALFGAALFAGIEALSAEPNIPNAMMLGALAFPVIGLLMNRQPIFLTIPDLIEVEHINRNMTLSKTEAKPRPAQQDKE